MDSFSVHKKTKLLELLTKKNYIFEFIPSGYTDLLHPLDVGIMRPFKVGLSKIYNELLLTLGPEEKIVKHLL